MIPNRDPAPVAVAEFFPATVFLEDLRAALHASQRDDPLLPALARMLAAFCDSTSNADRLQAWIAILDWTREGVLRFRGEAAGAQLGSGDTVRLRLLLHALESCATVRVRMQTAVASLCAETDATSLMAEAGMPSDRGFLGETSSRLCGKLLPEPLDTHDLRQFVRRCFRTHGQRARFQRWPADAFHRLIEVVMPPADSPARATLRLSLVNAVHLLCVRVKSQALAPKLRSRSRSGALPVVESPFFRLARAADGLLVGWTTVTGGAVVDDHGDAVRLWQETLAACRKEHAELNHAIRGEGISVDIVFGLDVIDRCLSRLELLGMIIVCAPGHERSALVQRLVTDLVRHLQEASSFRALASGNLRQLHRRIVEHSGRTGEHFIAHGRRAYAHLLLGAAGGGVLTVGTTAIKLLAARLPVSDFLHGLLYGVNYAVSFVILHHLHLVLATKHPAMTAATLATILRDEAGNGKYDEIVDRLTRISYSQIAAAIGNVLMVGLGALAFTAGWEALFGQPFLDHDTAQRTYASFSPLNSGTIFFAALTGVILWLSSVVGGWLDNWSAWRRIPRGIADHRLGLRLGRERMTRWGRLWQRHIGAWGSNISLGLMLGMTPALGHFLGIPLDVRHITLSTGMLMTACGSLHDGWYSNGWILLAASGICTMFVLNLGVSFTLSFWTALRALEIPAADVHELLRRLWARVVNHPMDFILPARTRQIPPADAVRDPISAASNVR